METELPLQQNMNLTGKSKVKVIVYENHNFVPRSVPVMLVVTLWSKRKRNIWFRKHTQNNLFHDKSRNLNNKVHIQDSNTKSGLPVRLIRSSRHNCMFPFCISPNG